MADINNIDEYRASVLSALGIEDDVNIRYFADYRKALLMGLSMPASNEDLRNEEKFRLKILEAVSNTNELISDLLNGTEYTEKTVSGNPASFDDGAYGLPLKSLIVNIIPKQNGSGDPSPINIRAIEPWTEAGVYQSGEDTNNFISKSIPLNREVYGGTLDVVSGVLTIDRAIHNMTSSDNLSWNGTIAGQSSEWVYAPNPAKKNGTDNFISDKFKTAMTTKLYDIGGRANNGNLYFHLPESIGNSGTQAKQWFADNPATVCYELATPTEIQLTPTEVKTLLGANKIWTYMGSVVVKYLVK